MNDADEPVDAPIPPDRGLPVGAGVGIGCGAYVLAAVFFVATAAAGWVSITAFVLIAVAAGVMMFFTRTRRLATGMLIVIAASWIIVIGPCLVLINGTSGL